MAITSNKRSDIISAISKRGQNPVTGTMYDMMSIWLSWYRGNVNNFHRYTQKNVEGTTVDCERLTLNMPKKVCEDWTTLLFNEKVTITVDNEKIDNLVQEVLEDNNFAIEFTNILEKSFALGNGAMIEYINNDKIEIDFITGDLVIPISYKNQTVNGICTVNEIKKGDSFITHLTYHLIEDDIYTIEHEAYLSASDMTLGDKTFITEVFTEEQAQELAVMDDGEVRYMVTYETSIPHFQLIKPNIVNNYDIESPMGISVFGNTIDTFKGTDKNYDAFVQENELARYRIIVDNGITKEVQKAENGGVSRIKVFNTSDGLFYGGNMGQSDKFMESHTPALRTDQQIKGINFNVQNIGFKCGFGTDYYAFDARGVYQNEKAVISENSDLWANKKKHEIVLIKVWHDLVYSILFLLREITDENGKPKWEGDIDKLEITVQPDDSIIIDDESMLQHMKTDSQDGVIPEWRYIAKRYKLSKEEAIEWMAEARLEVEVEDTTPIPNEDETLEDFIARFMSNMEMVEEYEDEELRREAAIEAYNNNGS